MTGPTTDQPHRNWGETDTGDLVEPEDEPVPAGYAVYDLVTGLVSHREAFLTPHGIQPYELRWADDDTLALCFRRFSDNGDPGAGGEEWPRGELWIRDLARAAAEEARGREHVENTLVSSDGRGRLVLYGDGQASFTVLDTNPGGQTRTLRMSRELASVVPSLSPGGGWVAEVTGDTGPDTEPVGRPYLVAGRIGRGDDVELVRVPRFDLESHAIGWADENHVLVSTEWADTEYDSPRVLSVDVRTGESRVVTRTGTVDFAYGLMDSAVVPGERPR